jgi:RecA/RadA recombinase
MHLRPDRLRAHAIDAAEMADALARLGRAPGPAAEAVDSVVARARRELAEIETALRDAAATAEAADRAAADAVRRAGGGR